MTFKDLKDPTSLELVQVWERNKQGYFDLKEDRMQEFFGEGVRLRDIRLEITGDSVTTGVVDKYLPLSFSKKIIDGWRDLPMNERGRLVDLVTFKQGVLE